MIFMLFAVAIAALFFVGSLMLLRLGRHLGLQYRKRSGTEGTGGLATVEGAIFGLMGLLLAFTISGALQRFDDRRQLVIQEATAATTAYDRLSLFGGDDARRLQSGLKEYVRARIDLYRMAHDFLLVQRAEDFSDQQERKVLELKNQLWDAAVAACSQPNYRPACGLSLPALNSLFEVARQRAGCRRKTPAADHLLYAVWPWSGVLTARRFRDGRERRAKLDTHGDFCRKPDCCALHRDRYGISASRPHPDREFRSFPLGRI
jgi:low affinity Fe/Cu permease